MSQTTNIMLNERHHAAILVEFYRLLEEQCGHDRGLDIFMTAARAYGRRRGRRMAMRALRDGNPLDMTSYFAYGELLSTEGAYTGSYHASCGMVHQHMTGCPWAAEFHDSCFRCGVDYCKEIDNSIIRGFNPMMEFSCPQNMHLADSCEFFYGSAEIQPDFMDTYSTRVPESVRTKREMAYHCADVYQMFCHVVRQVLPAVGEKLISRVREGLCQKYGESFLAELDRYAGTDFESIEG